MLCLGDSYTIGESVEEKDRFPMQTLELLQKDKVEFSQPTIIARTGWTSTELASAIREQNIQQKFDFVTLLAGVNDEYRGLDINDYRKEFRELLQTAIHYADGKPDHVFVLSIPDWGATPFAANDERPRAQIAKEIDQFNEVNKEEATAAKVNYIDITPISRQATSDPSLVAKDGLHPSAKMYTEWAQMLAGSIKKLIHAH